MRRGAKGVHARKVQVLGMARTLAGSGTEQMHGTAILPVLTGLRREKPSSCTAPSYCSPVPAATHHGAGLAVPRCGL